MVTDFEMQLIYARKKGISVNWARLIMVHMMRVDEKSKFLPYAYFLTLIMEEFGVDFAGFEKVNMDPNLNKISIKNVDSRMGVHFNPETKTITYIGEDVVGNEDNDQEVEGGEAVPPPPTAPSGPSNQELID